MMENKLLMRVVIYKKLYKGVRLYVKKINK